MNEDDLESPGYEYLRSYENMISLHTKLLVLNYEHDFCLSYKCPPIHRFYFSLPSNNPGEQRFLFTCLCAWLIKDKCLMNLEIEPEEYEDLDSMLAVVIEALRLITDDGGAGNKTINYPNPSRLRRGHGPEVIWTLSILADRALEILFDGDAGGGRSPVGGQQETRFAYRQSPSDQEKSTGSPVSSSITVGQPFVGGGLSTRPLGSYIIDDQSLLFDDDADDDGMVIRDQDDPSMEFAQNLDPHAWYKRVESSREILESVRYDDCDDLGPISRFGDWSDDINQLDEAQNCLESFLDKWRPTLERMARLIESQLQLIVGREKHLQTQLGNKLDDFLVVWRKHSGELARNKQVEAQVDSRTDKFESLDNRLLDINARIELRKRDLNDDSQLDELKAMIDQLKAENKDYDMRIGLLLAVYFKLDS